MTGVFCWHQWPVFCKVLERWRKGIYLASVLEREYVVELYELQMIQESFCLISCGRKWDSVFYGKIFIGKKCFSPSPPSICSTSMWKVRREGVRMKVFVLAHIKATVSSVLFLMNYRNSHTSSHEKLL